MAAKQIAYQMEAREAIRRGVKQLARAVKATLGPCGRNVVIEKSFSAPTVTKDGVTVAKEIELDDAYENMGAQMVKEVASRPRRSPATARPRPPFTPKRSTTKVSRTSPPAAEAMELKRGIEAAVETVVEELKKMSTPVKGTGQIAQVGTCAANQNATIGKQIADAMDKVGKDGVITVEEGKTLETTVELVEGMQFDKGYVSPHFINKFENLTCELEKPYILINEKKITSVKDIIPLLEKVAQSGRPLLVVAEDIEGEALATLVVNKLRGTLQCCAVKAPGFGDRRKSMLEDMAVLTGGQAIFEDLGTKLENITLADLGSAKKVRIEKEATTIIEGGGPASAIKGASSRSGTRSTTPPRITIVRNSRSVWRSFPAAWLRSTSGPPRKPR